MHSGRGSRFLDPRFSLVNNFIPAKGIRDGAGNVSPYHPFSSSIRFSQESHSEKDVDKGAPPGDSARLLRGLKKNTKEEGKFLLEKGVPEVCVYNCPLMVSPLIFSRETLNIAYCS